jgi:hypothetical protein
MRTLKQVGYQHMVMPDHLWIERCQLRLGRRDSAVVGPVNRGKPRELRSSHLGGRRCALKKRHISAVASTSLRAHACTSPSTRTSRTSVSQPS